MNPIAQFSSYEYYRKLTDLRVSGCADYPDGRGCHHSSLALPAKASVALYIIETLPAIAAATPAANVTGDPAPYEGGMKPYLHDNHAFMWNLDASVGKGAQNSVMSDVSYLQWYYTLAADFPETPPDRRQIYKQVSVTGACSGRDDDPLVKAILAQQRALNHSVLDGKASVVPGFAGSQRLGRDAFFVIRLGARLATKFPQQWPRLDLMPGCPASVTEAVLRSIPKL